MNLIYILITTVTFLSTVLSQHQTDLTYIPTSKGQDVTETVIRRIHRSGVFPHDDKNFIRRLAWIESEFGDDAKTYRHNYFGGIWQVDEKKFNLTKTSNYIRTQRRTISNHFDIDWNTVTWNDLLKPMYSGLAASLYISHLISSLNHPIPSTTHLQAIFWKHHYRHNGNESERIFTQKVKELEPKAVCQSLMDICFVLDGSGSISEKDFTLAKQFISNLANSLSTETRTAMIVFGKTFYDIFDFSNRLTQYERTLTISNIKHPKENTNTPAGLLRALEYFTRAQSRPGVPQVVVTFTDGQHNQGDLPYAVQQVKNKNLVSFAIGIGTGIRLEELNTIALNEPDKVFQVDSFDSLTNVLHRLSTETCEVPQEPEINADNYQMVSLEDKKRTYYKLDLPDSGLTVTINHFSGKVKGWYSYTEEIPSPAVYDGVIDGTTYIPNPYARQRISKREASAQPKKVYVTIEGHSKRESTNYTLNAVEGDHVPRSETEPPIKRASASYRLLLFSTTTEATTTAKYTTEIETTMATTEFTTVTPTEEVATVEVQTEVPKYVLLASTMDDEVGNGSCGLSCERLSALLLLFIGFRLIL